jgi:hypothetical protein
VHAQKQGSARPPLLPLARRAEMTRGERAIVRARPEYGYAHPSCGLPAPAGATADAEFAFDLQLLTWCTGPPCARPASGPPSPPCAAGHPPQHAA